MITMTTTTLGVQGSEGKQGRWQVGREGAKQRRQDDSGNDNDGGGNNDNVLLTERVHLSLLTSK